MAMPTALAKPWPSGPVVTSTPAVWCDLGVAGRARLPLAERLDVVELEAVAGEVQHRVLQDRGVAVGEHEAVAVGPVRIGRIVLITRLYSTWAERGQRHRRALVAALGLQRRVHREARG